MKANSTSPTITPRALWLPALSMLSLAMGASAAQGAGPSFTKISAGPLVEDIGSICGAPWGDLDGDGFPDVFVARYDTPNQLYRNNRDGTFRRLPFQTSTEFGDWGPVAASWADVDNDGDLDLSVGSGGFFLNDGAGNLALSPGNVSDALRLTGTTCAAGVSYADYDNDGLLDFVIGGWSFLRPVPPNVLFHNEGHGAFTKTDAGPVTMDEGPSIGMSWADFDMDGDLDLFVANMFNLASGMESFLYENRGGGSFVRLTENEVGPIATDSLARISGSWGDYDNDGDFDLFVPGFGHPASLYRNMLTETGKPMFVPVDLEALLPETVSADAGVWGDYDNDGFLDLFIADGLYFGGAPNLLLRNVGDGSFTSITDAAPVAEELLSTSPAWVDYDNDGFLDLFGSDGPVMYRPSESTCYLFRNEGNENQWLKVKCVGASGPSRTPADPDRVSNRDGIGAKVWLTATIRGQEVRQLREISSGSGRSSSTLLEAHFGLGDATSASTLRIEWPSGQVTEVHNLKADQRLTIQEAQHGPTLTNAAIAGAKILLTIVGEPGQLYRIEHSQDLIQWQFAVGGTLEQSTSTIARDLDQAVGALFYRCLTP